MAEILIRERFFPQTVAEISFSPLSCGLGSPLVDSSRQGRVPNIWGPWVGSQNWGLRVSSVLYEPWETPDGGVTWLRQIENWRGRCKFSQCSIQFYIYDSWILCCWKFFESSLCKLVKKKLFTVACYITKLNILWWLKNVFSLHVGMRISSNFNYSIFLWLEFKIKWIWKGRVLFHMKPQLNFDTSPCRR